MKNILKSNLKFSNKLANIEIDQSAIDAFVLSYITDTKSDSKLNLFKYDWGFTDQVTITLIFNSMNFCFWALPGEPKWSVEIEGELLDGSIALFGLIESRAQETPDLLNWDYLSRLNITQFKSLFSGSNVDIPLLHERFENLTSLAKDMVAIYDGSSDELIKLSRNCAARMLKRLIAMESFVDISEFQGETLYFQKRAQLQVKMFNDISVAAGNVRMQNLHTLTAFADYKVPQLLRHLEILKYSPELAAKVDSYQLIEKDSESENEIRIATIIAVEQIQLRFKEGGVGITSAEIDSILWRRAAANTDQMKPYHRTYTIAY